MAGLLYTIALILVLSGALKVVSPDSAADALTMVLSPLGVRVPDFGVRALGAAEMGLGVVGLVVGGSLVALGIAGSYLGFAAVAEILRRQTDAVSSCGCFGRNDTPPSVIHTAVNLVAAAIGFAAVVWPADDVSTVLADQPATGVPFVVLVLLGTYLFFLAFTALPKVFAPPAVEVASFSVQAPLASEEGTPS